jgi:hypothetical protein
MDKLQKKAKVEPKSQKDGKKEKVEPNGQKHEI